jgi:hypothetical protein
LIATLLVTILSESLVALGFCALHKKPISSILITSVCANLCTQTFLWGMLLLFFQQYMITLLIAEIFIWGIEILALYYVPANRLRFFEALALGVTMNLFSFALGWFLPR